MASFCDYYNEFRCRSCGWIETPYAEQLARKSKCLREALAFMDLSPDRNGVWQSPVGADFSDSTGVQGFRNRAKLSVTGTVDEPIVGLPGEPGALDQGRELLKCPIHHPSINALVSLLPDFIRNQRIEPYRIDDRRGELKGIIAFYSPGSDEMYLRFVLRSRESVEKIRAGLDELRRRMPRLICVSANLQPIPHALLEGPEEIYLTERTSIAHRLGEITLTLSPQAFVQTHVNMATRLYQSAADWIAEAGGQAKKMKMLELYCGKGAFSFFAQASARQIVGIEISAAAVATANETAQARGLAHVSFRRADATQVSAELAAYGPDLILVNPPRRGLGAAVRLMTAPHLIYSSCNYETLALDLRSLAPDYRLKRAGIFDLFPHTAHFEALVWLERVVAR